MYRRRPANGERVSKEQFGRIDERFNELDQRFEQVDRRFDRVDQRLDRVDQRFGQVKERLDRLETGQGKMSDRIEALDQHMHVLHEDVIARIAATREYTGPTRAEFAELKEMLGRRLDPLEATVRLHSREIDKLKRGRR
jgi:chromosome segregation ATPase